MEARINIIGASGTGKTTLGKALSEFLGCPYFDSDFYYHNPTDPPFRNPRSPGERYSLLMTDIAHQSSWVLSGAVGNWQPTPQLNSTLMVFLYLTPEIRLPRLMQRETSLYGARILSGGDMESDHKFFMDWTSGYDASTCEGTNTLHHHLDLLSNAKCPTLKIESPMSTIEQVQRIIAVLN